MPLHGRRINDSYIAAKLRRPAAIYFVLRLMFKSQTMKNGNVPNVQSAREFKTEAV
jgi:hypothetical protein